METIREQFQMQQVSNIYMGIDCATLIVETAEGSEISVTAEADRTEAEYKSAIVGDRLDIRYEAKHHKKHFNENIPRITIAIPRDYQCNEFCLELGAGSADMRNAEICSNKISIEAGAASVKAGELRAQESIEVEVGAGEADFAGVWTRNANLVCGVGQLRLSGKVEGDIDVECGLGKCDLNLEGRETDYNYDVSCGIGRVSVNGNRIGGIGGSHTQNSMQAIGRMNVSCGLGNVAIRIA